MIELAIDVSNLQGQIDWPAVSGAVIDGARITTVFIKASEGTDFYDVFLRANWNGAGAAGMRRVATHYGRPYLSTGAAEAQWFLSCLNRAGISLSAPDSYDLDEEDDGPNNSRMYADLRAHDLDYLQTVERAMGFTGYYYSRTEFMHRHNLLGSFDLARHKLWLAAPGVDAAPPIPRPWEGLGAWQFGQSTCPGIGGQVDFDYVYV